MEIANSTLTGESSCFIQQTWSKPTWLGRSQTPGVSAYKNSVYTCGLKLPQLWSGKLLLQCAVIKHRIKVLKSDCRVHSPLRHVSITLAEVQGTSQKIVQKKIWEPDGGSRARRTVLWTRWWEQSTKNCPLNKHGHCMHHSSSSVTCMGPTQDWTCQRSVMDEGRALGAQFPQEELLEVDSCWGIGSHCLQWYSQDNQFSPCPCWCPS